MVTITYNGITTGIAAGKKATLSCNGKKMKTDVAVKIENIPQTIDSPLPIEISTEAEMTALLNTAEVGSIYKYVGTTGAYENGALYVVEEDGAKLISFTIKGTTYQAEEGMTWGEWVASDYNIGGMYVEGNYIRSAPAIAICNKYNYMVSPSDIITDGYAYSTIASGGSTD